MCTSSWRRHCAACVFELRRNRYRAGERQPHDTLRGSLIAKVLPFPADAEAELSRYAWTVRARVMEMCERAQAPSATSGLFVDRSRALLRRGVASSLGWNLPGSRVLSGCLPMLTRIAELTDINECQTAGRMLGRIRIRRIVRIGRSP